MTPDKMRVKVAEACGVSADGHWRCLSCNREVAPGFVTYAETHDGCGHPVEWIDAPNYPVDLNACAEMELTLTDTEYHKFTLQLSHISWRRWPDQLDDHHYKQRLRASFSAEPLDRCEAFLRVRGLWEEGT